MKVKILLLILIVTAHLSNAQVKILFDTDFGGDADDLGALCMLHGFIESQECELLGIMVWSQEASVVPAIDAVNRYYRHPNIPIGIRKGNWHSDSSAYNKAIADKLKHKLTNDNVPEVTELYRKILSESKDQSIVLVAVGPLINIQMLLESKGDKYSPLSGKDLLHKKVKEMVVMGGQYPEGKSEWNFSGDMKGVTKNVFSNIEIPVVFSGYELGESIKTGEVFNQIKKKTPLYIGFKYFSGHAPWIKAEYKGKILDNSTFDQTTILYAVKGGVGNYWEKISNGRNEPDEVGGNQWIEGPQSNHSYLKLIKTPEEMAGIVESLMLWQ